MVTNVHSMGFSCLLVGKTSRWVRFWWAGKWLWFHLVLCLSDNNKRVPIWTKEQLNLVGTRKKIIWEEQLVDLPNEYITESFAKAEKVESLGSKSFWKLNQVSMCWPTIKVQKYRLVTALDLGDWWLGKA